MIRNAPTENQFWKYVLPSMFAMFLSGFYAIIDGFFVGQAVGDPGLAAINIAWPLSSLLQAAGTGIGAGGAVVMSTLFGKKDLGGSSRAYGNTFVLLLIASAAMTAILLLSYQPLLRLLGAEGEVLSYACDYTVIVAAGSTFQILGTGIVPLLRNKGRTISAMAAMVSGLGANIVLDAVFVMFLGMGTAGAAAATIIAQAIVAVISFSLLWSDKKGRFAVSDLKLHPAVARRLLKVGLSPFGMTFAPSIVIILSNLQCLAYGGTSAVAAYSVLMYIVVPVQMLLQGVGEGVQPIFSYFSGAGNQGGIRRIYRKSLVTVLALSAILLMGAFCFRRQIPILFGASPQAAQLVAAALLISCFSFPLVGFVKLSASYFYAIGEIRSSSLIIYTDPLVFTPVFLFVLPPVLGINGIWMTMPFVQGMICILLVFLYKKHYTHLKAKRSIPRPRHPKATGETIL